MLLNQRNEAVNGFGLRYAGGDTFLADVEIDFSRCAADVAEIGVRHFARSVYDAAHDSDGHAVEVRSAGFDFAHGFLDVVKRTTAARAGDVFRSRLAGAGALEDGVGELKILFEVSGGFDRENVADAVAASSGDAVGIFEKGRIVFLALARIQIGE